MNQPVDYRNLNRVRDTIEGADLLQHKGDVPIYMDRILSDEDFKQIRKLRRKQEEENMWNEMEIQDLGSEPMDEEEDSSQEVNDQENL